MTPLAFAYALEKWRWGVFEGSIKESQYNEKFWELTEKIQGIVPPTNRKTTNKLGLDAAAIWHVSTNVEYIRYFVSYILTFQFHESLCLKAGEFRPNDPTSKPLFQCDFTGSKVVGKEFS